MQPVKTNFTRKLTLALVVSSFAIAPFAVSNAAGVDDTIKARQAKMKELGGHMKYLKGLLGGSGTLEEAKGHALAMQEIAKNIPSWFPEGSGKDDAGVGVKTTALATIWSDMAGFKKISATMAEDTGKLAELIEGGDKSAIGAQYGAMAKASCGGCHQTYREKK